MKQIIELILIIVINLQVFSDPIFIGVDSGRKEIMHYSNGVETSTALVLIGGIHPDETQTIQVVEALMETLVSPLSTYYIPNLNPTLYSLKEKRRGYLREHLNIEGFVIPGSNLEAFNKDLYYRAFYGTETSYKNTISNYIDPNRDFKEKYLPSTRALIKLLEGLSNKHSKIVILSFHGYMSGGRAYPEYQLNRSGVVINPVAWELCKVFTSKSGYIPEQIYAPAIPIIERFAGELIAYTGRSEDIIGIDIELNSNKREENIPRSLLGVDAVIEYLFNK